MPRLSPSLLRFAASRSAHLPRLLRECRDIDSATNELRWLAEYADKAQQVSANSVSSHARLRQYVRRRARGEPLQYILGSQPFGPLDILCRKKVLIPRPETEAYSTALAELLINLKDEGVISTQRQLKVADLCTGTGCIALLLHALLQSGSPDAEKTTALKILGADVSHHALQLAYENLQHNINCGGLHISCENDVSFEQIDVLEAGRRARMAVSNKSYSSERWSAEAEHLSSEDWDVIVSNPPYISLSDYAPGGTVTRSVRDYEPKLALVPPAIHSSNEWPRVHEADQFYEAVTYIARKAETKVLLMEIGDGQQAERVRKLVANIMPSNVVVETWRDDGSVDVYSTNQREHSSLDSASHTHLAHERAVVVWTGSWATWRLGQRR